MGCVSSQEQKGCITKRPYSKKKAIKHITINESFDLTMSNNHEQILGMFFFSSTF